MNKRGISSLIIILIFVLFNLITAGVLWSVINNVVTFSSSKIGQAQSQLFQTCSNLGYEEIGIEQGCSGEIVYARGKECCLGDIIEGISGLVGYWALDDGSGTIASDTLGKGNDGVVVNFSGWVDGISGEALEFDGEDDYVTVKHNKSLNTGKVISISFWYAPPTADWGSGLTNKGIVCKGHPNSFWGGGASEGYCVGVNRNSNHLAIGINDSSSIYDSISELEADSYNHIVITYGGAVMNLYINGNLDRTYSSVAFDSLDTDYDFNLGAIPDLETSGASRGKIDEVRIYNKTLSESEIKKLHSHP